MTGDAEFNALAEEVAEHFFRNAPSSATYLGIHKYDDQLEDFSAGAFARQVAEAKAFQARLDAIDPATLSEDARLDREFLSRQMAATAIQFDVIRMWTKDADSYATAATNSVYTIMKRGFAPPADRLRLVIEREKKMPALFAEARQNLENPPEVFTRIAIEQIDGNQAFFATDLPLAFAEVTNPDLLAEFKRSNDAVISALGDYKTWLVEDLLPRSNGSYVIGPETYSRMLAANEMIELPLDELLKVAEADRQKNEAALIATARRIDPRKSVDAIVRDAEAKHPAASDLLKTTQDALDEMRQFVEERNLATIPPSAPARVQETPPFMRSTTSASMDTPGPFEDKATEAYYNMTLPDRRWTEAAQLDFMRQWYYASISNVSVHEVYPGHYLQFLYAKDFPTITRKVFGSFTNIEGWAHYGEQMMLDEGFHGDNPEYRIAQLQDALLRNVRFIVGIRMHTQGMTIDQARQLFETQGHQPPAIALAEAKRGAGDPFYGYYTMGKLAVLKLRDDYAAKLGSAFSLRKFHDAFVQMGPLPLPLVREKLLGERGALF